MVSRHPVGEGIIANTDLASGCCLAPMRTVGVTVLKNRLSEYIQLVIAGETILVTDRDRVVAELRPPSLIDQVALQ